MVKTEEHKFVLFLFKQLKKYLKFYCFVLKKVRFELEFVIF